MHLISLAGQDALLATPNRLGLIKPTNLFARLRGAACDIHPKLIVLDNSADVFGGSENDRTQVRQFIGILRSLAIAANAGVLLTSHPSLTGINSGSGISGSTAWHASVRSRLYMKRAVTDKDEEPDPNLRVIEVMKANYGPVGETITVRWQDGLFLPETEPGSLGAGRRHGAAVQGRQNTHGGLRICVARVGQAGAKMTAPHTAPHVHRMCTACVYCLPPYTPTMRCSGVPHGWVCGPFVGCFY